MCLPCISLEQFYCCHLFCFFLFLYLNMLSETRIAQYNDWATCRTVQGSNSVTGKISSPRCLTGWRGVFPGGLTQNSHPSSADLKNVWRCTSTPLHSWRAYGLRVGIRESKLQDIYTCRVWSLKVSFAIVITINRLRGWRAERCSGWMSGSGR